MTSCAREYIHLPNIIYMAPSSSSQRLCSSPPCASSSFIQVIPHSYPYLLMTLLIIHSDPEGGRIRAV